MKSIIDKITKARVQLLSKNPFWGTLLLHLKFKEDKYLPTMGVTEFGIVYYQPKFIEKLTLNELKGVLAHEVGHVMLMHLQRLGNRDPFRANIAMDLALNLILTEEFVLPDGALIDKKWKNMSWEEIYDKLPKRRIKMCTNDCKNCPIVKGAAIPSSYGDIFCKHGVFDKHIFTDQLEKARGKDGKLDKGKLKELGLPESLANDLKNRHKPDWYRIVRNAYTYSKQIGKLPLGIERIIKDLVEPKLSWRQLLSKFLTRNIPFNYSYKRPSRKSISSGIFFPSIEKEELDIIGCVDTSGSMSSEEVRRGISEFLGILRAFQNVKIHLFSCDARLYDVNEVASEYSLRAVKLKGRGGTDFRPIFKWIRENKPRAKVLVYFTDAYGTFPKQKEVPPNLAVLWVISEKGDPNRVPKYFPYVIQIKSS